MATRSTIALMHNDGSVSAIYCHFDGGYLRNGKMLVEHYSSQQKVYELTRLGAISVLQPNVFPNADITHNFDHPQDDVVVAYHRDRGEELNLYTYPTLGNYIRFVPREEYNYILIGGLWFVLVDNDLINLKEKI